MGAQRKREGTRGVGDMDGVKRCSCCRQVKPLVQFSRDRTQKSGRSRQCLDCIADGYRKVLSLDKHLKDGHDRYGMTAFRTLRKPTDETWEKVLYSLGEWITDETLSLAQAESILMHDVELLTYKEIAELVGCHYSTVRYHYIAGVNRLKNRYAQEVG